MVQVRLSGTFKSYAGGRDAFEIEAANVRQLLDGLGEACPKLRPILDKGVAVAIDGEIYRDSWFQSLRPDSEVFILPRLAGG
ncbi:MoaD/ThiS family protein [Rhodospirillaceae bacterium SYSU D60014]|uniref:MoaD/ThiS family protein n=1 Tax=Virgifigura deserti TaxID=2268457 RepID=UPI000E663C9A